MFMSCHVNLNLVLQIVLWLPTLQAFSSLVKGLYRNIDIRKYSFLTIDEMFLHSNLFHTATMGHLRLTIGYLRITSRPFEDSIGEK